MNSNIESPTIPEEEIISPVEELRNIIERGKPRGLEDSAWTDDLD